MFDPPRDGILTCVKKSNGKVCALACKEGFDFSQTPALFYVCEGGVWSFVTLAPADLSVKSSLKCKGELYKFISSITTRISTAKLTRSVNKLHVFSSVSVKSFIAFSLSKYHELKLPSPPEYVNPKRRHKKAPP